MAITRQTTGALTVYQTDGSNVIVFTDNGELISSACAALGLNLEFNKSNASVTEKNGWLVIADDTQRFTFLFSEGGYATGAIALAAIDAMIQNVPAPPIGAGATEATQLLVLNAIQNEKDFGIQLQRDTGNANQLVLFIVTKNEDTGAITTSWLDASGAAYIPVGPMEFVPERYTTGAGAVDALTQRVTLSSATETPSASTVAVGASNVAAGKISVTFTTSVGFTGTILGEARAASTTYTFNASPGNKLAAIAYEVTAGTMTIDVTV